eukprot:IDg2571t1
MGRTKNKGRVGATLAQRLRNPVNQDPKELVPGLVVWVWQHQSLWLPAIITGAPRRATPL